MTVVRGAPRDSPFALLIRREPAAGSCQGLLGDGPTERCKDLSHGLGRLGVLRLWNGKRQPRRCPTEVLSVWRARLTPRKEQGNGGQMPEARGQKQETRRGKGEGGGRRGAGWLRLPGLHTGCRPRSLGDPLCPSFSPPPTHSRFLFPALRFLPVNRGDQMTLAMTSDDGFQIGLSPWTVANPRQPGPRSATSLDLRRNIVRYLAVVAGGFLDFPGLVVLLLTQGEPFLGFLRVFPFPESESYQQQP